MRVFATDLDNTIIYSYKHDIGEKKRSVEVYQERQISFITEKTYELLCKVNEKMLIVPTTTRTEEQYKRIDLGLGHFPYALVCNGGVLLLDGKKDEKWYNTSLQLVKSGEESMVQAMDFLKKDSRRTFEIQWIENLFVFTKCNDVQNVVEELRLVLDNPLVDVFHNGAKLYVVPKNLSKGMAVERLKEYLGIDDLISAGDSEFDLPMLECSDTAFAPASLAKFHSLGSHILVMGEKGLFAEEILNHILEKNC